MTPLGAHIAALIASEGPITVADFMALALGHPLHGYYMTREPFGTDGDFVTAPEISQMFGELIGLWCADLWQRIGAPERVVLAELGPGRGTLMADALRAAGKALPAFVAAVDLHLVETSPRLRTAQARALGSAPHWHDRIETLPSGPLLVIANEFFDALPVRQIVRTERGWCERFVTCAGEELTFAVAPDPVPTRLVPAAFADAPPGSIGEIAPARASAAAALARRLADNGGAALLIDYGYSATAPGDTLQALKGHNFCDPLAEPGHADVTAHVDFQALAEAARSVGAAAHGPVTLGAFLDALGIGPRAAQLKRTASPEDAAAIDAALARLTSPAGMGDLFKVLAITAPGTPAPAGF